MTGPERRRVKPPRVLGLTLTPPWSNAIKDGSKRIENRTWKPSFLGGDWLALHGGKVYGTPERLCEYAENWYFICQNAPHLAQTCPPPTPTGVDMDGCLTFDRRDLVRVGIALKDSLVTGIFGVCKVRGTLYIPEEAPLPPLADKWYAHGQHGWRLTDVVTWSDTIPCSGKQGLWPVPDEAADGQHSVLALIKHHYWIQTGKELI